MRRRKALQALAGAGVAPVVGAAQAFPGARAGEAVASRGLPSAAPASAPARGPMPILVLNSLDASVSVIEPGSYTERERIPTGREPHHLYLTPDESSVIVANASSNSLTFIDPRTAKVQRVLRDIVDPYHLRFSPDMKWFVTAANRLDHVDLYRWEPADRERPLKLARRLTAPKTPSHLFIDDASSTCYCSLQDSDQLLAIDLHTQQPKWTISVGRMPADVYLAPDNRHLFIGLTGDRVVQVIDTQAATPREVARIPTGAGAHAFRARGDGRHLFVSNRVANTLSLIDVQAMKVVQELPGPAGPDCMDLLADGRTLLLTSRWAGKLSIIDTVTRTVQRQVQVGRSPHGVWTLAHAPRR